MIVLVLIFLLVVNVHSLWIYELLPSNQCGVDHQRRDFEAVVWPWISAIVNVYLPLVISATLSILLAVGPRPSVILLTRTTAVDHPDVDDVQLSRVCIAIGVVYVVTTSPVIAFNLVEYFLPEWEPVPNNIRLSWSQTFFCRRSKSISPYRLLESHHRPLTGTRTEPR